MEYEEESRTAADEKYKGLLCGRLGIDNPAGEGAGSGVKVSQRELSPLAKSRNRGH